MIALKRDILNLRAELDVVEEDADTNFEIAMSAAAAAHRHSENVDRKASAAMEMSSEAANGAARANERIDILTPAFVENIASIDRLRAEVRAMRVGLERLDHLVFMLMEHLGVESVREPEINVTHDGYLVEATPGQEYVAKRRKSR